MKDDFNVSEFCSTLARVDKAATAFLVVIAVFGFGGVYAAICIAKVNFILGVLFTVAIMGAMFFLCKPMCRAAGKYIGE